MSTSSTSSSASASASAHGLVDSSSNSNFKIVGICLAVGSGLLIGSSFVIKKKGLIESTKKYGNVAGEGHGYLKSWLWWAGMITMIVGEICNFVAYAFTEAILVTPMGALSVVVAAILSHFLLKEKLTFFGWIGCTLCIMGAVILALNAPEQQSVTTINEFKKYFLSVGFLVWAGILIAASLVMVFFVAPKWGKKSMLPYISICSLIGGISVSCTQGLGASIVTSIQGNNQVKNWFFWFLFVFVVVTLLIEINYLNKALELFNTSMVVPVYFCFFSSATLITSFILYKGLKASAVTLITMVLGFLVTCLGITLLQLSKVDPETLDKLDRKSTILMQASRHQTEDAEKGQVSAAEDPGMDALRGGFGAVGSIIRAKSFSRRMSSASSLGGGGSKSLYGYGNGNGNLSTHGLGHLERFQLSDNPMPSDAMDQISLHSAKSPLSPNLPGHSFPGGVGGAHSYFPSPQRSKSNLKASSNHLFPLTENSEYILLKSLQSSTPIPDSSFSSPSSSTFTLTATSATSTMKAVANTIFDSKQFEEADVVHQYHYGTAPDETAIHTYRKHSHPPPSPSSGVGVGGAGDFPTMGYRQPSATGSVYPVIEEEDFAYDNSKKKISTKAYANLGPLVSQGTDESPYQLNYLDPNGITQNNPNIPPAVSSSSSTKLNPQHKGLSGLFHFPSGPDLSLNNKHHNEKRPSRSRSKSREKEKERDREGGEKKFPLLSKKHRDDELDKQERTALVESPSFNDEDIDGISKGGIGSDDDDYEGRTTEVGHAEIGVGKRINVYENNPISIQDQDQDQIQFQQNRNLDKNITPIPTTATTRTTFGSNSSDRSSLSGSATGSSTVQGNRISSGSGLMGPRAPRGRNDPPGFAGPRYGS
ncbi:uncharacterized protein IL334_007002 [Kwoniella shivajii]|uniref:DUF803-domain-containing protein n=1 Tax=Kwoniella shivajii TaxID=564305 RepID=A0ABZ1D9P9_9TREE|nr:hypothetical protein IL334_007002 [Kwoniella shivajii]